MKGTREVITINLDDILPNRFQPRIKFDDKEIVNLSESIKEHGVIQPIIVRKIGDKYEIIAGERRYKASVMAGKMTIPAVVVELNDKDSSEIALIENVQRQDLTPIEEAISYRKRLDMGELTQEDLAKKLGVTQSTIANKLRLLNLDDDVQDALLEEKISERHARSLLKLTDVSMQREMLKRIINERLTVRKTDEEIDKMINGNKTMNDNEQNNATTYNNQVVQNNIVNEQPVNIKPENIEVLDFNDMMPDNITPSFNNNIPSTPIIEDVTSENISSNVNFDTLNGFNNPENVSGFNQFNSINDVEPQPSPISFGNEVNTPFNQEQSSNVFTPINNSSSTLDENKILGNNFNKTPENNISEQDNEELRPRRFFNILNSDEESENSIANNEPNNAVNSSIVETPNNANFENVFSQQVDSSINTNLEHSASNLNADIEPSNILNQNIKPDTNNIFNSNINENNSVHFDTISNQSVSNNAPSLQSTEAFSTPIFNMRDVINSIRTCADNIEKNNFEIDCEEFDFDDIYQVIFKIKKK